jgi:hypothetical protein
MARSDGPAVNMAGSEHGPAVNFDWIDGKRE